MKKKLKDFRHRDVMWELQKEWENINNSASYDDPFLTNRTGIRSTQISALVSLLIRKGILKPDEEGK